MSEIADLNEAIGQQLPMGAWERRGSFLLTARSPTFVVRMFKRTYDVAGKLPPNYRARRVFIHSYGTWR
jgi:hypothetical protein